MERSKICPDCEKRPIRVSLNTCRNGVRIRVDLCSACWLERFRSGEPPRKEAETKNLGASADLSAETIEVKDVDLTT